MRRRGRLPEDGGQVGDEDLSHARLRTESCLLNIRVLHKIFQKSCDVVWIFLLLQMLLKPWGNLCFTALVRSSKRMHFWSEGPLSHYRKTVHLLF